MKNTIDTIKKVFEMGGHELRFVYPHFNNIKKKIRRKSKDPFERLYKDLKRETDQYLRTAISKNRLKND
jgi:hypothetical protein